MTGLRMTRILVGKFHLLYFADVRTKIDSNCPSKTLMVHILKF